MSSPRLSLVQIQALTPQDSFVLTKAYLSHSDRIQALPPISHLEITADCQVEQVSQIPPHVIYFKINPSASKEVVTALAKNPNAVPIITADFNLNYLKYFADKKVYIADNLLENINGLKLVIKIIKYIKPDEIEFAPTISPDVKRQLERALGVPATQKIKELKANNITLSLKVAKLKEDREKQKSELADTRRQLEAKVVYEGLFTKSIEQYDQLKSELYHIQAQKEDLLRLTEVHEDEIAELNYKLKQIKDTEKKMDAKNQVRILDLQQQLTFAQSSLNSLTLLNSTLEQRLAGHLLKIDELQNLLRSSQQEYDMKVKQLTQQIEKLNKQIEIGIKERLTLTNVLLQKHGKEESESKKIDELQVQLNKYNQELLEKNKQLQGLSEQKGRLAMEVASLREQLQTFQDENKALKAKWTVLTGCLEEKEEECRQLKAKPTVKKWQEEKQALNDQLKNLESDLANARAEVARLQELQAKEGDSGRVKRSTPDTQETSEGDNNQEVENSPRSKKEKKTSAPKPAQSSSLGVFGSEKKRDVQSVSNNSGRDSKKPRGSKGS